MSTIFGSSSTWRVSHPEQRGRPQIVEAIDRAVWEGFFLFLLSPEALRSRWVREEVRIALDRAAVGRCSNIVPILVRGDLSTLFSHGGLGDAIARIQFFDLTRGDRAERIAELVESLKTREMEPPTPADSVD